MNRNYGIACLKRYFVTSTQPGTAANTDGSLFHCESPWHYVSLPHAGFLVVMMDGMWDPDPTWTELAHLLETKAANFNGVDHNLGAFAIPAGMAAAPASIGGVTIADTTFAVAKKLAAINRHFHP